MYMTLSLIMLSPPPVVVGMKGDITDVSENPYVSDVTSHDAWY